MKNFYTNRNFNFIKLFTKNSNDVDYKFRFNQDIFNKRDIDPSLSGTTSPTKPDAKQNTFSKNSGMEGNFVNSHFAWQDSEQRLRRKLHMKRLLDRKLQHNKDLPSKFDDDKSAYVRMASPECQMYVHENPS